jgi:hypothetical protein
MKTDERHPSLLFAKKVFLSAEPSNTVARHVGGTVVR